MLRVLAKVFMCAALGAASTVVVAWGLALLGAPSGPWNELVSVAWANPASGDVTVYGEGRAGTGVRRITLKRGRGTVGPDWIEAQLGGGLRIGMDPPYRRVLVAPRVCHPPEEPANCSDEYQFGWPLTCLWSASDTAEGGCMISVLGARNLHRLWPLSDPPPRHSFGGDTMYPYSQDPQRQVWFVPTGVLRRSFAIDSGCYAAAWWIVLLAPGAVRRAVRLRRGQCASCAYDLSGNAPSVCPECGEQPPGAST